MRGRVSFALHIVLAATAGVMMQIFPRAAFILSIGVAIVAFASSFKLQQAPQDSTNA